MDPNVFIVYVKPMSCSGIFGESFKHFKNSYFYDNSMIDLQVDKQTLKHLSQPKGGILILVILL